MGKMTIQEIARILVEKNKLSQKEANQFAAVMFEIIQQQLDKEGLVKVKGLGTFKMIRVEARESVSVRTGERVMIDSHAKVTFTPDATMKELVNKPFSQFETVTLNDGVEFDDLADDLTEEEQAEVEHMEEEPAPVAQPLLEVVDETENQQEEEQIENNEEREALHEDVIDEEEPSGSWMKWLGYVLLTLVLMAASAYAGYWYGQQTTSTAPEQSSIKEEPKAIVADSTMTEDADSIETIKEPASQPEQSAPETKKEDEEPFWKKYEAMDIRVRTGAYHIVGTDHEVKARKGETLARISRRELGEGMSCYMEVYNGMKPDSVLKEGQIVNVPKLKWKKR